MAFYLKSTAYTRMFKLISSTDHISAKTGVTATVNISKAGAAFGAAAGTVTEVANGWYKVALTTADTGTAGDLAFYITGAAADDTDFVDQVIDPATANIGVNLVNVAGSAVATGTAQLGVNVVNYGGQAAQLDANNLPKVDVEDWKAVAAAAMTGDAYARLGAPVGASVSADVAALKTDLDAGVKVSVGTAAGQINVSGGKVPATVAAADVSGNPNVTVNAYATGLDPATEILATPANKLATDVSGGAKVSVGTGTGQINASGGKVPATVAAADVSGNPNVTVNAYATGLDPATEVLATPANKLTTDATGRVTVGSNADKTGYSLTAAYDPAKTAAQAGNQMDLVSAPNATAITALQAGLATSASIAALPTATQNADGLLKRDMSVITGEAARSPLNALRAIRNKATIAAGTLTVTKEDDTTTAWTGAVSTDPAAQPIVGIDPA